MPTSITTLTDRRVLKAIIDERGKSYTALTNLLFPPSQRENLFEEYAQVDVETGTVGMAPFVTIGQKAVMVPSTNGKSYTITTPLINIKRPITYTTALAKRMIGQSVFTTSDSVPATIQAMMTKDANIMNTLIDNRIEWMVAHALRGEIDYSVEGQVAFNITSGKPSDNTYTVSAKWDDGSATPLEDIRDAKAIVAANNGPLPTIGICGSEAAAALRAMLEGGEITAIVNTSGIDAGTANLRSNIQEDGMMFIGRIGDVDFWEYLGTYIDDTTSLEQPFIRAEYVEYFSTAPRATAKRELLFGAMPDLLAIEENQHITDRYYVTKKPEVDQGTFEGIMKARPLPWIYRPDWQVSQMVVA